ncbi:hypothetical protein [Streptomyces syringium]|uniref:hypothetical protein n=1 Tax=Streptomyces syringium TaxID=76729 RepID=UPI003AB0A782
MDATYQRMLALQTAGAATIEDQADVRVRGYLKEHPDLVAHRLDLLAALIDEVRTAVARERAAGTWPPLAADPATEHAERTAEYAAHTCTCLYCLRCA